MNPSSIEFGLFKGHFQKGFMSKAKGKVYVLIFYCVLSGIGMEDKVTVLYVMISKLIFRAVIRFAQYLAIKPQLALL